MESPDKRRSSLAIESGVGILEARQGTGAHGLRKALSVAMGLLGGLGSQVRKMGSRKRTFFMVLGSLFGVKNHEIETRKSDKTPNASPKHSCCSRHVFWESASGLGKVHIATNAPIFPKMGSFICALCFLPLTARSKNTKWAQAHFGFLESADGP